MTNFNFFNVEIGFYAKSGMFAKHFSFVCKTDKKIDYVKMFYQKQYAGFSLKIDEIKTILEPIFETIEVTTDMPQPSTKFDGKISISYLSENSKSIFKNLLAAEDNYNDQKELLHKSVLNELTTKYSLFSSDIRITKKIAGYNANTVEFTVFLDGKLT